ncbi:uncharacterized protein [Typha latifolia]|uniref:uncharacterized protein n=1 Tax=Typha latifolia TaxID=4733 RepID=UPI003C2DF119
MGPTTAGAKELIDGKKGGSKSKTPVKNSVIKKAKKQVDQRSEAKKRKKEEKEEKETKVKKKMTTKRDKVDIESNDSSSPFRYPALGSAACSFPMSRVRRLVRSDGGNGNAASAGTRTTPDAVFLINRASELFLEKFAEDSYRGVAKERKKSVSYLHLSSTVNNQKRYEFLSDFVPAKVSAEDALRARASVET